MLTHNTRLPALTNCALYQSRGPVESHFERIEQGLRVKRFRVPSENAVKSQVWIPVSVYMLSAIVKNRLALEASFVRRLRRGEGITHFAALPCRSSC